MSQTLKAVRGTRDLLPPETALWNRIEATARDVFARYNFGEIRTPIFEDTALFARSVGEETDIVSKEMYTWEDRARAQSEKTQSLTLRPENTAGVVRAYIEHGLGKSSFTSAPSSAANARRRAATASSRRSAPKSSARHPQAAKAPSAMPKSLKCWPRFSTSWASAAGPWS
jgi:histidyl-tRNA synthetase